MFAFLHSSSLGKAPNRFMDLILLKTTWFAMNISTYNTFYIWRNVTQNSTFLQI